MTIQKYLILSIIIFLTGCQTIHQANRTNPELMKQEPRVGFVRPDHYTILLGTRSISDYIEITYERQNVNQANYPTVELGLRDRGGQHFWDVKGPAVVLSVKTSFYNNPISASGPSGPPVYETNWQPVRIVRGDTAHYKATSLVQKGIYYQVRISELIK